MIRPIIFKTISAVCILSVMLSVLVFAGASKTTSPITIQSDDIQGSFDDAQTGNRYTTSPITVTATHQTSETPSTVYSVTIAWGSMNFVYRDAYAGEWDSTTHTYTGGYNAGWWISPTTGNALGNDSVQVTNLSNVALGCQLVYRSTNSSYAGITGTVTPAEKKTLAAASNDSTPSQTFTLSLDGVYTGDENSQEIGKIQIILSPVS